MLCLGLLISLLILLPYYAPPGLVFAVAVLRGYRFAAHSWIPLVLGGLALGYVMLVGSVYYGVDDDARVVLFLVIPLLASFLAMVVATLRWRWYGWRESSALYLAFVYLLVVGFAFQNMRQFLLCHHGPDHVNWSPLEILAWPYMLLRGESLPTEPCYWS